MQPFSGNQRPDLLTALMNMSLVLRLPRKMHLCRSSSNVRRLPSFFGNATKPWRFAYFWHGAQSLACACHAQRHLNVQKCSEPRSFLHFWFRHVLRATTACTFSTSQLPKVVRSWCALYIFTSKRASRHNGMHFFDISTSKSGSNMWCFAHFDFEMCFAPQGVQFFISALASWLRTRRFSEPTFRPSGATNHWKNTVFRDFPTFSRTWIFFLLTLSLSSSLLFSSLTLPTSAFHLSILSEVWLLNFLRALLLLHMTWRPEHIKSRCGLRQDGQSDANQTKLDNIAIQNQNHHIIAQNHHRRLSIRNVLSGFSLNHGVCDFIFFLLVKVQHM